MEFYSAFQALTGHPPLPWQERLYREYFAKGRFPSACCLPTGLGKTSVIAVWLIALANCKDLPRRLIYVVNRRTVVDQTTDEVVRYQQAIQDHPGLATFRDRFEHLRISTLRGQFADNGDWCEDPSIPAVICGTVDMIGSRLLFSGYGIGRNKRPLHAGFLGQDALLIHDEAHLEPAFQKLIEAIEIQQRDHEPAAPWPKLKVMELTATTKSQEPFTLEDDDYDNQVVHQRMNATKRLYLHELKDAKKPAKELSEKALSFRDCGKAILIFAQKVKSVLEIHAALDKARLPVLALTGTMRGEERDKLVNDPVFARFLPSPPTEVTTGTVYLVCTSAGEVGVNISADHLICDLTTFESMAQRFGRVNRFGTVDDCEVHVLHPTHDDPREWDDKDPLTVPRQRTLQLLHDLVGCVNSKAISQLDPQRRAEAFAPIPTVLPTSDMLFDAWALTSITEKLPGRPPVERYLHGLTELDPPETQIAWRADVDYLCGNGVTDADRTELLFAYPLLPKELLREPSQSAITHLEVLGKRHPDHHAWLVDDVGEVQAITLDFFANRDNKEQIFGMTVVLSPRSGGLSSAGMLDGASETANDVSETEDRCRSEDKSTVPDTFHEVFRLSMSDDEEEETLDIPGWYARRNTGEIKSKKPVLLESHVADVERHLEQILNRLSLDESLKRSLRIAARFHDDGKRRISFQSMLGNRNAPKVWWAKSGRKSGNRLQEKYRHEFGSLNELPSATELGITDDERELVMHLIAAHHGRARPHFPADEVFDPHQSDDASNALASAVAQRFGRLQRRYGRWGLAYLESLLRAADWSASANPNPEGEIAE